jgi:hypothetical protein
MTADRAPTALPLFEPPHAAVMSNGQAASAGPKHARPDAGPPKPKSRRPAATRGDVPGRCLIAGACILLASLAVAMGITSFHAQFTYIFATKRQWAPAVLEALGLDVGAVTFSLLGIALARLGRRAAVERALVVLCALGSCGMNVLNANLDSPRSIAVYGMPPILFALTSDRLIAVVRRAALGGTGSDDAQRSAWDLVGKSALYGLRLAVDRRGTASGVRQAILNATPLPEPPNRSHATSANQAGIEAATIQATELTALPGERQLAEGTAPDQDHTGPTPSRSRPHRERQGTKTAQFLALVRNRHGQLAEIPLELAYRISAELAPEAGLHAGSARKALRQALLAAKGGPR